MAGYGYSCIKFWTLQPTNISEKNISTNQYYTKESNTDGEYHDLKKAFISYRNESWILKNKRPHTLRDSLKYLEDVFKTQNVLYLSWKKTDLLQIIFSSGLLVKVEITSENDIAKIWYVKNFVGKIADGSTSGVHGDQFVCFAFENQTKLHFSNLQPEIKMYNVDIPGCQSKIKRYLCLNSTEELIVCWWHFGLWLQTARDNERVNVVLLRCSFGRLEVLDAVETEHDLFHVVFSKTNPNRFLTLEKSRNVRKESLINTVVYECANNSIQRLSVISLPVKSGVLSYARNSSEDKLVVGCSNGSLVIYDLTTQNLLTSVTRSSLVPTIIKWIGDLIVVGSGQAEVKIFDTALNPLLFYDLEEQAFSTLQLTNYLTSGNSLLKIESSSINNLSLLFNGGPIALVELLGNPSSLDVIKQHLSNEKITEAIQLLSCINWNDETEDACSGLLAIADHLLQEPLNPSSELEIEATLAAFYASKHPIADDVVVKYRSTIGCYARRFFYHLLRHQRFEKAFLLAKDINSSDLFLDIYFAAKDLGEMQLAKVAKLKADEILAADSFDAETEDWSSLAKRQVKGLINRESERDQLGEALKKDFSLAEGQSSTLKVTNLGYV